MNHSYYIRRALCDSIGQKVNPVKYEAPAICYLMSRVTECALSDIHSGEISHEHRSQAYNSRRRILIQVLPAPNAYTRLLDI